MGRLARFCARKGQTVTVILRPGLGNVVGTFGDRSLVAECKGGVVNTTHAGQLSRLRRGLCEAVGLLMARSLRGERHVAVVPETPGAKVLSERMLPRVQAAQIAVALVDVDGKVSYVGSTEGEAAVG